MTNENQNKFQFEIEKYFAYMVDGVGNKIAAEQAKLNMELDDSDFLPLNEIIQSLDLCGCDAGTLSQDQKEEAYTLAMISIQKIYREKMIRVSDHI